MAVAPVSEHCPACCPTALAERDAYRAQVERRRLEQEQAAALEDASWWRSIAWVAIALVLLYMLRASWLTSTLDAATAAAADHARHAGDEHAATTKGRP